MDYYTLLTGLLERVSGFREDRPTAGTKYRLMGLVADIAEVVHALQDQVLQRVSQEAVLDVDVDIDYAELSEQVLMLEYEEYEAQDEAVREQAQQVNEGSTRRASKARRACRASRPSSARISSTAASTSRSTSSTPRP